MSRSARTASRCWPSRRTYSFGLLDNLALLESLALLDSLALLAV